jgi:hypothetical protein
MFRQLAEAYTRLDDDPQLRVGVLHAFGDHFTAGLDLPAVSAYMQRGEKAMPLKAWWSRTTTACPATAAAPSPWWWRCKGICFTVGIELMLGADIVVAADNCRFSQMEVQRGIMATGGATLRMAERAGTGQCPAAPADRRRVRQRRGPAAELCAKGGARWAGAGRGPAHCPAHCGPGSLGCGGHPAQRAQGGRARATGRDGGVHCHPARFVGQRGCRRRCALLCREAGCAVYWQIGSCRKRIGLVVMVPTANPRGNTDQSNCTQFNLTL